MQQDKITKKIEQIEKVSKSEKEIAENIWSLMDKFGLKSLFKPFNKFKRSGALVTTIGMALIVLPFVAKQSVWSFVTNSFYKGEAGQKDAFYSLKNNSNLNWRVLLWGIARRFIALLSSEKNEGIQALILDDTTVMKTGKNIERSGYVHNHVSQRFVLGYKILVAGYWDTASFIPIDFSIHREKRDSKIKKLQEQISKRQEKVAGIKNAEKQINSKIKGLKKEIKEIERILLTKPLKTLEKKLTTKRASLARAQSKLKAVKQELKKQKQKLQYLQNDYEELDKKAGTCGLKEKDYKNQFKKQRERNTPGYKRIQETDKTKIDSAILMIKRALKNGFKFEYILTDSWFFCGKLLQAVVALDKSINLVSMAKIGKAKYTVLPDNKNLAPKQIIQLYKRRAKTNRKYKAKYIKLQATYQDVRVVLFLINIGKGENWRLLVSTDLNIGFNKLMEVYKIRWTIEVFFKEAKQYLLFGKSQSQDFDAQIADTTLSLIRYILLSYYERTHYGMTIGGLFKKLAQASVEENLVADLSAIFIELLTALADITGIDFMTFYEALICQPELQDSLARLKIYTIYDAA